MANIKDFKAIYAINNQANWLRIIDYWEIASKHQISQNKYAF